MYTLDFISCFFFFNDTATTEIYTLSLTTLFRSSLCARRSLCAGCSCARNRKRRSEEHTSELQSPCNLVCRLLLEKKKCILSILFLVFFFLMIRRPPRSTLFP